MDKANANGTPHEGAGTAPAATAKNAVLSLVLGIFSVAFCFPGPLAGILAIVRGIRARREIRESGGRLKGNRLATAGVGLGWFSFVALGLWLGLWLPPLNAMRGGGQTPQTFCSVSLKQIGLACEMYANEYAGAYPPDFVTLAKGNYLDLYKVYVCPATKHKPAESPEPFAGKQYESYAYFGAGLKKRDATAETIIAADQPGNHKDSFAILFADGHVQRYTGTSFAEIIQQNHLILPPPIKAPAPNP